MFNDSVFFNVHSSIVSSPFVQSVAMSCNVCGYCIMLMIHIRLSGVQVALFLVHGRYKVYLR